LAKGYGPQQAEKIFQTIAVPFLLADLDYSNTAILEFMPRKSIGGLSGS
jgi:hypothetical protein